jgi:hypothetical protein
MDLTGYHIYCGSSATQLNSQISVNSATTSYLVSNLEAGTWYFAVTAYNSAGFESAPSNTVSKLINRPRRRRGAVRVPGAPRPVCGPAAPR